MSDAVRLLIPIEGAYRSLGVEMARKYLELAGGSQQEADALADAVTGALTRFAGRTPADAEVALAFAHEAGSIDVEVRCAGQVDTITQPIPVRKP